MFHADVKDHAETATGKTLTPGYIPATATLPAVAYQTNFAKREATMEYPSGSTTRVVRFFIQATKYDDLETIAGQLHGAFSGLGGDMGDTGVIKMTRLIEDETEVIQPIESGGRLMFVRQMAFELTHR